MVDHARPRAPLPARAAGALLVGLLWLGAMSAESGVLPAGSPIRTLYVAPMSHLDIGFTHPSSAVAERARRTVGQVLQYLDEDPDYVWTFETFWQLEQWLRANPTEEERARLLRGLKSGRLGLGAAYANPHSALMSAWALDWLFRLPVEWAVEHGLRPRTVVLNDVPGHPGDLPRFLARNGVRYLVIGANLSFSPPLPTAIANTPFWWEAPSGERVLTWIADRSYTEAFTYSGIDPDTARFFNGQVFKDPDPLRVMEQGIGETLGRYASRGYPYDAVLALHAFDNWGPEASRRLPEAARLWNRSHAVPKIRIATPEEFMRHLEERYGKELPVHRGGFGGQWEAVKAGVPTALRLAAKAERTLRSQRHPNPDGVRRLLTVYEHSFSMGTPWPNYMTPEEAARHNREQYDLLSPWRPKEGPDDPASQELPVGVPAGPLREAGKPERLPSEGLYCVARNPMYHAPALEDLRRPEMGAWARREPQSGRPGETVYSYAIDRRRLPDPAFVFWLWELDRGDFTAPVLNRTASGWESLPRDALAGYSWGGWASPWGFRLGKREFHGEGVFVFRRLELDGRSWLLGLCLSQGLAATFKGGVKGAMPLEEAYPGEQPVVRLGVRVRDRRNRSQSGGRR